MTVQAASSSVIVVGGGPAGLTAALALAAAGVPTTLVARRRASQDARTTALLSGSVNALTALGVWQGCAADAAPLQRMRIVDDTGRLFRGTEITFDASEIGLDTFGQNIPNPALIAALEAQAERALGLIRIDADATAVVPGRDNVTVTADLGDTLRASLVVGCDGRRSLCRTAAGIATHEHRYPQTALTFTLAHTRPHHGVSTEFHRPGGPFTLVPLPGDRSSLVHVTDTKDAATLQALDDNALALILEQRAHSILGKFTIIGARGVFPLVMETADRIATRRIALVGEAAHVLPPIGAQGLNLGLRDAATIAELAGDAVADGRDPGAEAVLAAYDTRRKSDLRNRATAVDMLNRSLLTDFLPLQMARRVGLLALDRIAPLRQIVMREGLAPGSDQPRLMQEHDSGR
ncbi:MAG TPA: UbiH/UbiF family hydroxylase [Xanthobacteraceae bacterium]|nr:UbiH/UbiF family hydroxylase [Xanthobacteraceae bacterium]